MSIQHKDEVCQVAVTTFGRARSLPPTKEPWISQNTLEIIE